MKKTLIALALAAAPFLSASATEANGIGYTYAQLDYVYSDLDRPYLNGGQLSGSYAFTDNIFMTGTYGSTEDKTGGIKVDGDSWSLGAGYAASIGSRADWVSQISYVDNEMTFKAKDRACFESHCKWHENYRGGRISTGVMGRVTDSLTANAYVGYEDYSANHDFVTHDAFDYKGNFFADFGAVYAFNPTWALHGGLTLSDVAETATVGVRASF